MGPYLADYHVHSTCSGDSSAPMADLVRRGIELNLREIAFTEHLDLQPDDPGYGYHDYDRYCRELDSARVEYGDRITLRSAVEITYQKEFEAEIRDFFSRTAFDYVLGSVHNVALEFLYLEEYYHGKTPDQVYFPYWEEVLRAARSGWFDCLGHLDLPKRYSHKIFSRLILREYAPAIDEILRAAVHSGTGLEINTSGLRQDLEETLPSLWILKRFRELGGEVVTIGSDTHQLWQLGTGLAEARELAREAGFKALTVFEGRRPRFVDLV